MRRIKLNIALGLATEYLLDKCLLELIDGLLTNDHLHSFILSFSKWAEAERYLPHRLLHVWDPLKHSLFNFWVVVYGRCVQILNLELSCYLGVSSLVNFYFANSVSTYVNIVYSVFKLWSHFVAVFMQRLLNYELVSFCNLNFHNFRHWLEHQQVKVNSSDRKSLNLFNRFIEKFRTFILQTTVVIDWSNNFLGLGHDDAHCVEYLIKQPVANTNCSFRQENYLKHLFILILNHVISIFIVESGL